MLLPIETERLILRRFTIEDVGDIYQFATDPSISQHLNGFPGKSVEEIRDYIAQQNCFSPGDLGKCFDLAVHLKAEEKVIGLVTLVTHESYQGEVGFALNTAYQRQGYATEAVCAVLEYGFIALKMHRIFARTGRQNISSWLLLERVGMRREGLFVHDHQEEGQWQDTFIYALLAGEWMESDERCLHTIISGGTLAG